MQPVLVLLFVLVAFTMPNNKSYAGFIMKHADHVNASSIQAADYDFTSTSQFIPRLPESGKMGRGPRG